jgi:hypothetical protein
MLLNLHRSFCFRFHHVRGLVSHLPPCAFKFIFTQCIAILTQFQSLFRPSTPPTNPALSSTHSTAAVTRSGELTAEELKAMFAAREFPLDDGAIAHTLQKMVHGMCLGVVCDDGDAYGCGHVCFDSWVCECGTWVCLGTWRGSPCNRDGFAVVFSTLMRLEM